jgi:hypothetical protein
VSAVACCAELDHDFDIRLLLKFRIDQVKIFDSRIDASTSPLSAMLLGPTILRVEAGNLHRILQFACCWTA